MIVGVPLVAFSIMGAYLAVKGATAGNGSMVALGTVICVICAIVTWGMIG